MLKQLMLAPKAKERVRNILFSPSSCFYLAFSIFSLALIGYLFILQITWNGINAQVTYRSGNLTIDYFGDSSFEELPKMGLLSAGDKIIEVDDLPVKSLVAAEYGLDKNRILLYLTAEDINELPRETPLKEGESAFLTGVKAATITIDMSQRVNKISTPPNNSSGSCHCELVPSGTTEKFKLDLLHLKYNIGQLAVIVILLFTALSFWFIGLFLYLVRPQQPITGQFQL